MTIKLAAQLAALNQHKIIDYMDAQGFQPVTTRRHESIYQILIADQPTTIIADHYENRFIDEDNRRQGSLTDLVCLLYACKAQRPLQRPEDVRFRNTTAERLIVQAAPQGAAFPFPLICTY